MRPARRAHRDAEQGVGDQQDSVAASVVTPMFHLKYKLDEKGEHLFRQQPDQYLQGAGAHAAARSSAGVFALHRSDRPNDALSTDRIGNPTLKPELATGFDLAYERYSRRRGASATVFYRRVQDLIRNRTTLETVSWASVPRYVTRPVNFES